MNSLKQSIHDIFEQAFAQKPGKPFIVFGDQTITYGDLRLNVEKYTTYFKNLGLKKGDRVLFSSTDEPFVCMFLLSLIANGITLIYLDPEAGSKRTNAIIDHCEPHAIFLDEEQKRKWHLSNDTARPLISISIKSNDNVLDRLLRKKADRTESFPASVNGLKATEIPKNIDPESDAIILFTSGTTSAPKGVRMSYRALFSHMESLTKVYDLNPGSRLYNNLMLSHTDGMTQGPILTLFSRLTLYRPFPFSIQRIEDSFDVVYREKVTHWLMVPTMIALIHQFKQNDRDVLDHQGFRYVISCGGMLEAKIWQDFEDRFKTTIINGYGLTETIAGGLFAGPDDASHKIGTIGKPIDCEAKIVDENGKDLPAGEQGELWIRGSLIMSGYYKAAEATADVFDGDWLKTGDLSYLGLDGCYRIVGRKKSAIVSGGVLIIPEEITEVLNLHPSILESVTFAVEDEIWGEKVACAICTKDQASVQEEEIMDHCRQHLEPRKIPAKVYFIDKLPRGRSGKVMLPSVREMIAQMDCEREPTTDGRSGFLQIVSHSLQIPDEKLNESMIAEETPEWDSIRHLVMIADLENHFNIAFSPVEVMNIKKLSDLSEIVESKLK